VLKELIPSHDARSRVRGDESWALGALWVCSDLLAHVLADACEPVLDAGTVLEVVRQARALLGLDEFGGLAPPALDLTLAPLNQVVHVLKELIPSHDARSRVRGDESWALGALWVCSDLLAHVLADACELVLD